MSEPEIRAPRCPGCDGEPMFTWVLPYFCSDDTCAVLSWDPYEDPARFKATSMTVNLPWDEPS